MGLFDMFKKKPIPEPIQKTAPDTSFVITMGIANLFMFEDELRKVMGENPKLKKARKIPDSRIFVLAPYEGPCDIVPVKPEEHDPNSYKIIVNGLQIGYTPYGSDEQIQARLAAGQTATAKLMGGNYRVFENGEWVTYKNSIKGTITLS